MIVASELYSTKIQKSYVPGVTPVIAGIVNTEGVTESLIAIDATLSYDKSVVSFSVTSVIEYLKVVFGSKSFMIVGT